MAVNVSVTDFRNRLADWLDLVLIEKKSLALIKRGKVIAEVLPKREEAESWGETMKLLEETFGIWADIPEKEWKAERKRVRRLFERW